MENQSVLAKYARQPKIYLSLPSGGKFWPNNPMEKSGTGELPIYSMTAKDELMLKTPDALMNGEATVNVIKSCCPLIDDPWTMPSIDLDAILIAIRIATYGEQMEMEIPVVIPNGEKTEIESETFSVDLRQVLDEMQGKEWPTTFTYGELTFHLRPLNYRESTQFFQNTYESQRLATLMQDEKVSDEDKVEAFKIGLKKLSQLSLDMICKHVVSIDTPEGSENDPTEIRSFFDNTDKDTFSAVRDHIEQVKESWSIKPRKFKISDELVEKGAKDVVEVPLMFDQSNFFVSK